MAKQCDLQRTWIRRDINQLADDLTNEKSVSFDAKFWIPLKGWILDGGASYTVGLRGWLLQ